MEIETKNTSYYPSLKNALFLIVLLLLIELPFSFTRIGLTYFHPEWKSFLTFSTMSLEKIVIILIGLRMMKKRNMDGYKLKFKPVAFSPMMILVFMMIALMVVSVVLKRFLPPMPERMIEIFRRMYEPNPYTFISAVIIAPIAEEIFFRGILLEGFFKNYKPAMAIILSALLFGVIHMNRWQAVSATLSGLLIGWAYWKTDSLIPGIVLHFVNNLIVELNLIRPVMSKMPIVLLVTIAVIVLVLGFKLLNKRQLCGVFSVNTSARSLSKP